MKQRLSNTLFILACTFLCVMSACTLGQSNGIVAEGEAPVKVSGSYSSVVPETVCHRHTGL